MTDAERLAHDVEHYELCRFCETYHLDAAASLFMRRMRPEAAAHQAKAKSARERGEALLAVIQERRALLAAAPLVNLSDAALALDRLGA